MLRFCIVCKIIRVIVGFSLRKFGGNDGKKYR